MDIRGVAGGTPTEDPLTTGGKRHPPGISDWPGSGAKLGAFPVYHLDEKVYLKSAPLSKYVVKYGGIYLPLAVLREVSAEHVHGHVLNSEKVNCRDDNLMAHTPISNFIASACGEWGESCSPMLVYMKYALYVV